MNLFQHHPDGWIYIKNNKMEYMDSVENFKLDANLPKYSIGIENMILRYYVQGSKHYVSDGSNEIDLGKQVYSTGDSIISNLANIIKAKESRLNPILPPPTKEALLSDIRINRNKLLSESDWTQFNDSPLSKTKKTEWTTYRKELRDFPSVCDPYNPVWPKKPE